MKDSSNVYYQNTFINNNKSNNLDRYMRALELNKVLDMLAGETTIAEAAEEARLLLPSCDASQVDFNLKETYDAFMMSASYGNPNFGEFKYDANAVKRAQAGGSLTPKELLQVSENLRVIRSLAQWRDRCEEQSNVDPVFSSLSPNNYLETRINGCILNETEIADKASQKLFDIRSKIKAESARIKSSLNKLTKSPSYQKYLQDFIVTMRGGRYVVPVKSECKNSVPGLVHDVSASGGTVFIEPMAVVEANNEINVLKGKEKDEIERILLELSNEIGGFADSICDSEKAVIKLNVIFAKANLAYKMKACVPVITTDGVININNGRHPLIDSKNVVPISVTLGRDYDTLIITGPNTGGKTVSIKTIGLLTLMAMCGLMVPAIDGTTISVFDNVLVDIGDEQSIEQSLSTFSAHMTNLVNIISLADSNSLVLVDEVGSGTDPVEGAALATAILEKLRERHCKVAATTHYAELKEYALDTEGIQNASCEFNVETLKPTYKLLIGTPGRSNAFLISKKLGLDETVIERAKSLVSEDSVQFENVIARLEENRQALEKEKEEARLLRIKTEESSKEIEELREKLKTERDKYLKQAQDKANEIISKTRDKADKIIEELEQIKKQKNIEQFGSFANQGVTAAKGALNKLEKDAGVAHEDENKDYKLPRALKPGDDVEIMSLHKRAVVLSAPKGGKIIEVQAGIIKTKISIKDLKLIMNDKTRDVTAKKKSKVSNPIKQKVDPDAKRELDLRGKNVDESLMIIEEEIEYCHALLIPTLWIIHGKGTGVLRKAVMAYLKGNKMVKSYRGGNYGEGDTGVTIATIKMN